jgi:site-specific DNA-cytosine methylase
MKEITIIDQVKEVAEKSGVPLEIDVTQLATLAARGKEITDVNHPDFYAVKKEMQQTRTHLKDYFMDARRGFNQLAEGVRDVEKAVLAEFTPEEERLIALDKAEKERVIRVARLAALPAKRERITIAGVEFTDEEVLAMDDADFELEFAKKVAVKAEADRIAAEAKLAEERAAFEAEKAELARKKEEAERIEKARQEERERAERALKLQQEEANRKVKEAEDRAKREKQEAEERRKAEEEERILKAEREERERKEVEERKKQEEAEAKAKQEADKKYQVFLKKNKFNPETDIIKEEYTGTRIYRLVAEFKN